jgi:signal transduction histidine kinase
MEVSGKSISNPLERVFVLTIRDITEHKEVEAELIAAKEHAEEIALFKSSLLANVSHELRTPLTGIIGFAQVLGEEVEERHRDYILLVEESGKRLLRTINTLLDYAKLEAGAMKVALKPLDLVDVVVRQISLLEVMAAKKGLAFVLTKKVEEAWANLDAHSLDHILNNLVGNAIKFTDEGRIALEIDADERRVYLRVSDTGIGISETFLPNLFEEFRQESTGLARTHPGSGLGLAITKQFVDLLEGEIEVESTKGSGSTFTVSFPRMANVPRGIPLV